MDLLLLLCSFALAREFYLAIRPPEPLPALRADFPLL
jgi:hypothetical protein